MKPKLILQNFRECDPNIYVWMHPNGRCRIVCQMLDIITAVWVLDELSGWPTPYWHTSFQKTSNIQELDEILQALNDRIDSQ